jgi:hypothetical protein
MMAAEVRQNLVAKREKKQKEYRCCCCCRTGSSSKDRRTRTRAPPVEIGFEQANSVAIAASLLLRHHHR